MATIKWSKTDKVIYHTFCGVMAAGILLWGIGQIIESCRSRPKVQSLIIALSEIMSKPESEIKSEKVSEKQQ